MPKEPGADIFKEHQFSRRVEKLVYRARRRLLRAMAVRFEDIFRELFGLRIRIEPKEALVLYERLKEGVIGKQLPTIYHKILKQKEWLAKKWYSELRRRLLRRIELAKRYESMRDNVYRLWEDIERLYRVYVRLKRDPYEVAAILSILLRGKPYPNEAVAECLTERQGFPGLGRLVASGRYVLGPNEAYRLIMKLREIHPHRLYVICTFFEERVRAPRDWHVSDRYVRVGSEVYRRVGCIKIEPSALNAWDLATIYNADVVVMWAAERWPTMRGCI